jgi:HEAT repeat protein
VSRIDAMLKGGDPRSLTGVTRVIDDVLHDPTLFGDLVRAMAHHDAVVRMRAGDAVEKIGRTNPDYLEPHRAFFLKLATTTEQPSLRWHLAQLIPRLTLTTAERRKMVGVFKRYLGDSSAVVRTSAMQAIADFALVDPSMRRTVLPVLRKLVDTGSAATRVRAGRLLQTLEQRTPRRTR